MYLVVPTMPDLICGQDDCQQDQGESVGSSSTSIREVEVRNTMVGSAYVSRKRSLLQDDTVKTLSLCALNFASGRKVSRDHIHTKPPASL